MIVAAVDQSAHARDVVTEAASLSDAFNQPFHVVHVMSQSEFVSRQQDHAETTGEPIDMDAIREIASEHAESVASEANISGEYTPVGVVGDASSEIVEYANAHDATYIVVGPRRRSPTGKAVFGSTSQSVLLNASCAVVSIVDR